MFHLSSVSEGAERSEKEPALSHVAANGEIMEREKSPILALSRLY
jgi:hypothetical protein